ncbi:PAAR domain-containing protein [Orbus wheelerorum]|uniref:PAAR domain-containing protein n=1 Tax=Orbus wheelerorum TaxID=3074111 RepID=UPI00370DBF0D
MKGVIRLNDRHSHGGLVVSASGGMFAGKPVALIGDYVTCPIEGHGVNRIIEGHPNWRMNGKNVAVDGCRSACGCYLISTLPTAGCTKF